MAYKVWVTTVDNEKEIALFISNLTKIQFGVEGLSSDHNPTCVVGGVAIIQLRITTLKHPNSNDAIWVRDRITEILSKSKLYYFSLVVCEDNGKTAWEANDPGIKIESKNIKDITAVKRRSTNILEENLIRAGIKPKEQLPIVSKEVVSSDVMVEKTNAQKININENLFNIIIKVLDKSTQISDVFFENNKIERKEALNYLLDLKKNVSEQQS